MEANYSVQPAVVYERKAEANAQGFFFACSRSRWEMSSRRTTFRTAFGQCFLRASFFRTEKVQQQEKPVDECSSVPAGVLYQPIIPTGVAHTRTARGGGRDSLLCVF